jgi:uncharacterized protein
MARFVVTGATGTIGRAVCVALLARGDEPVALSRHGRTAQTPLPPEVEVHAWAEPTSTPPPTVALEGATGIVNLLGEPVAQRWTAAAKQRIYDSRVLSTRMLVAALKQIPDDRRPSVLVSQSATGYYGPSDDKVLNEQAPAGHDFLAGVVRDWESEALTAAPSARVVLTRTGVALAPGGGALSKMLPFFRAGIGGPVAGGKQFVPWIHIDDVVASLLFCLDEPTASGPINLTAPNPVTNSELSRLLGKVLHRPAVLPVPALALKALYGAMAEIVTTGQRVVPQRLEELDFAFQYPELEPALRNVLS